jgi:hypothetical protein
MTNQLHLEALRVRRGIAAALSQLNLEAPMGETLVGKSAKGNTWLIAKLTVERLGSIKPYAAADTLHQISTRLGGRPVFVSNGTGIRYLVLMSSRPRLPGKVEYPQTLPGDDRFPLGVTMYGGLEIRPQQFVNILAAGAQGSGKSTFLLSLASTAAAYGYELWLADPDLNTFGDEWLKYSPFEMIAQTDAAFLQMLERLGQEIARRSALFAQAGGAKDLDEYNARRGELPKLARALLLADEANTFMGSGRVVDLLGDLARRGRKWGVHLVLAAHNWRAEDVSRSLSAMLPARVCFRVADDTSGRVVLGSPSWGKRTMGIHIETPGRGIVFYNGEFRWVQAYNMTSGGAAVTSQVRSALNEVEIAMVRYAVDALGGKFPVNQLAEKFVGQGMSHWKVYSLAANWERRGWLTRPAARSEGRSVTDELRMLAGIGQTSEEDEQAEQGI